MNKKQIIHKVYKNGKKYEGCLFACYSKEIFKRSDIYQLVKQYHASETAFHSTVDTLIKKGWVRVLSNNKKEKRYTVTREGEKQMSSKFPGLRYAMSSILDRHISPDAKPPGSNKFSKLLEDIHGESEEKIVENCFETCVMLLSKNRRYGNSSLEPFGLFPNLDRESKIEARMEDKLKRIQNIQKEIDSTLSLIEDLSQNSKHKTDYLDAIRDLTGYLHLYQIAIKESLKDER